MIDLQIEINILKSFCEFYSFFFFLTKVSNCPHPDLMDRYLISFKVPNLFLTPLREVLDKPFLFVDTCDVQKGRTLGSSDDLSWHLFMLSFFPNSIPMIHIQKRGCHSDMNALYMTYKIKCLYIKNFGIISDHVMCLAIILFDIIALFVWLNYW